MSLEELANRVAAVEKTNAAILNLLRKVLDSDGKLSLNITAEDLTVYVTLQRQQVVKNFDTSTMNGRILFCAIEDLQKAPFAESEMSQCLAERSWTSSHGAVSPALSRMVSDNMLIRENGSGPVKYRLPGKITVQVNKL